MTTLHGKKVVVVKGVPGIGFAVAPGARDDGAKVIVASSKQSNVDAAAKLLWTGASGWAIDANNEENLEQFFIEIGSLDHLAYIADE